MDINKKKLLINVGALALGLLLASTPLRDAEWFQRLAKLVSGRGI